MTFDPISYVYVPTAPRSKGPKSEHKAIKHDTTSKKSQNIQPVATMPGIPRAPVAEDIDEDRELESRILREFLNLVVQWRLWLTAGISVAEMATSKDVEDDKNIDSWPSHMRLLYIAQRERRLGLFETSASDGEMEEDVSDQGMGYLYNSASVPGDSPGNTPGAYLSLLNTI